MKELPISKEEIAELRRLASTEAGKELLHYLQKNQGAALRSAVRQANTGNYEEAKELAKALLNTKEVRDLLQQLGR